VRSYLYPRALLWAVLLLSIVGLLTVPGGKDLAQAGKGPARAEGQPGDKTKAAIHGGPRTTLLLLRTATCLNPEDVITTLRRGMDVSECSCSGVPTVTLASAGLMTLFDKKPGWTRPASTSKCINGLTISQVPNKDGYVRLALKDTADTLQDMVISYRKAGNRAYNVEVDGDLQREKAGAYLLKLEADDEPVRFTCNFIRNEENLVIAEPFPVWERVYFVILHRFTGELNRLFVTIKDPAKVPNAFDDLREGPVVTMALVDLDSAVVPVGDTWDKNDYIPTVAGLPKRKVKRAWVRFPLTETEAAAALAAFKKLTTRELSMVIRKEAILADAKVRSCSPGSKAMWYELAANENASRFLCRIPINDVKGLHRKYHRLYRLLVYEFDDGKLPEAILVSDNPGCCKSAVVMQEITR